MELVAPGHLLKLWTGDGLSDFAVRDSPRSPGSPFVSSTGSPPSDPGVCSQPHCQQHSGPCRVCRPTLVVVEVEGRYFAARHSRRSRHSRRPRRRPTVAYPHPLPRLSPEVGCSGLRLGHRHCSEVEVVVVGAGETFQTVSLRVRSCVRSKEVDWCNISGEAPHVTGSAGPLASNLRHAHRGIHHARRHLPVHSQALVGLYHV